MPEVANSWRPRMGLDRGVHHHGDDGARLCGLAHVNRNHVLLEARSWLLSGRHLGIGSGDRSRSSQGPSRLIEGGVRLAMKVVSSREILQTSAVPLSPSCSESSMVRRGRRFESVRGLRRPCKSAVRFVDTANGCHALAAGHVRCSRVVRTRSTFFGSSGRSRSFDDPLCKEGKSSGSFKRALLSGRATGG
jgi:hypothetical protein